MIPRRPLATLAAASLLLLAGCSDGPFAPIGPLAGEVYVLSQVNGHLLPAVVWEEQPGGVRLEIIGGTLEFRPFGRVERTRILRLVEPAAGTASTTTIRQATYYRVREASPISAAGLPVRIGSLFPCPAPSPTALSVACDPEESAVVNGDVLELASVAYGAMSVTPLALRFERASVFR